MYIIHCYKSVCSRKDINLQTFPTSGYEGFFFISFSFSMFFDEIMIWSNLLVLQKPLAFFFFFLQERFECIIYNGESLKCSRKSSLQRGLEREWGYTAFQMCLCGEGHAFGDIYSTWLHCKGFLARGRFCSLPPPLGPINTVHAGAQRCQCVRDTWPQDVVVWKGRLGSHSCKATGLMKVCELLAAWGPHRSKKEPLGEGKEQSRKLCRNASPGWAAPQLHLGSP